MHGVGLAGHGASRDDVRVAARALVIGRLDVGTKWARGVRSDRQVTAADRLISRAFGRPGGLACVLLVLWWRVFAPRCGFGFAAGVVLTRVIAAGPDEWEKTPRPPVRRRRSRPAQ